MIYKRYYNNYNSEFFEEEIFQLIPINILYKFVPKFI